MRGVYKLHRYIFMFGIGLGKVVASLAVVAAVTLGFGHGFWNFFSGNSLSGSDSASESSKGNLHGSPSAASNISAASDAELSADLSGIDTQLTAAGKESADVEQSFNDQQIDQAQ
jgi:hypothetical protein